MAQSRHLALSHFNFIGVNNSVQEGLCADHATITFWLNAVSQGFFFSIQASFLDNFQAAKIKVVWSLWLDKNDNASQVDLYEKAKEVLIPEAINITRLKCFPALLQQCYKNRTCFSTRSGHVYCSKYP